MACVLEGQARRATVMARKYKALRGTKDILPADSAAWQHLERITRELFGRYGFREIRTPLLESAELFARSVGRSSDIVRKEMYTFGREQALLCLRPENTASVVRAFVEHALHRNVAAGYPDVQAALIVVVGFLIGTVTPPLGVGYFTTAAIAKASLESVAVAMLPYLVALFGLMFLLVVVPGFTMWLPTAWGFVQ